VVALFGGVDLDLVDAGLPQPAVLDVVVAFGGVDIQVPEGWRVRVTGIPLFAGWSNKARGEGLPADAPELLVNAVVAFGGVEVATGRKLATA
jgi:hypothetical protein